MAIITISRGCFSHGEEISEQVAKRLKYECLSQEFLIEASRSFHVPEDKLLESIHDAPGILERITHVHEKFLSYIQSVLLEHVKNDNIVYHGYGGQRLIPEVSHLLKIRVIAEMEDRIALLQKRKKVSRSDAIEYIHREDRHRTEWNNHFYGNDMSDPRLYDMVLNIGRLKIRDACEVICAAARSETYVTTPESAKEIRDFAVKCNVIAALQDICDAEVTSNDGIVNIRVSGQKLRRSGVASPELRFQVREQMREDLEREIMNAIKDISAVKEVLLDIDLPYYS